MLLVTDKKNIFYINSDEIYAHKIDNINWRQE